MRSGIKDLIVPVVLILLSLIPSNSLRQTIFAFLGLPLAYTTGYPFPYTDKPWFVSYLGGITIAVIWAILIYFGSILVRSVLKKMSEPVH